ncbi:MAG TPA: LysR family transcriptional regulator [Solirubrobacterales bacterium]|nr:LysR family transcriptional regulator [Solirubrobacterales bacterium]
MRIEQLEYLISVARHGSFRRAAEELHISQPALSETVRRLEQELGVDILDRRRSGATISESGRVLLPYMQSAVEAIDQLRRVADDQHRNSRVVRLGTVTAATVPLMTPTIHQFRATHEETRVEILTAQQDQIHQALLEGGMDLGLVNYLAGDDMPPEFEATELLRGRPVVCIPAGHPLATETRVRPEQLASQPLVAMRSGYVMHRYLHRLLGEEERSFSYAADGAEMGKLMVAAGLGVAVLPDYSVIGDPLTERGDISYRAIEGDETEVLLILHRRRSGSTPKPVRDLHELFVKRARAFAHAGLATGEHEAAKQAA